VLVTTPTDFQKPENARHLAAPQRKLHSELTDVQKPTHLENPIAATVTERRDREEGKNQEPCWAICMERSFMKKGWFQSKVRGVVGLGLFFLFLLRAQESLRFENSSPVIPTGRLDVSNR